MELKKKILIIEDDLEICHLLEEVFSTSGHAVISAKNLDEVKQQMTYSNPDIVLANLQIPGVAPRGEIINVVRTFNRGKKVQIILTSASAKLKEIAHLFDVPYLQKPFSLDHLIDIVEQ